VTRAFRSLVWHCAPVIKNRSTSAQHHRKDKDQIYTSAARAAAARASGAAEPSPAAGGEPSVLPFPLILGFCDGLPAGGICAEEDGGLGADPRT
jgi:hypothetical protein